jgi:hypothetical protein
MKFPLFRYLSIVAIFLATVVGVGCVSVPNREFKSYSDAFEETKGIAEQLLLEYDAAKRIEEKRKSKKSPTVKSSSPYPSYVRLTLNVENGSLIDHVGARREALQVISGFNSALLSLAEGKKPEEIKSSIDSLTDGIKNVAQLVGENLPIPYAGEIGSLISTVIAKLEEAHNRKQFVSALREAEPIIQGILLLFAKDAQDIYLIRARQTDRLWTDHQDKVATLIRQMRNVAKEHTKPSGAQLEKLVNIEKKVRKVLGRAGLKDNSEKLPTEGNRIFGELTLSQLEQTLVQAKAEADKYEAVINAQAALHKVIISYGQLLAQTKSTLTTVRLALDAPMDIRQQANELIVFVFAVKRDWDALNAARRSAASD